MRCKPTSTNFGNTFENCSPDQAYQGAIDFVHHCISQDRTISQDVRTFITQIHKAIHSSLPSDTAQQLSKLIPSTGTLGELLSASTNLFELKWTLLFGLLHADFKRDPEQINPERSLSTARSSSGCTLTLHQRGSTQQSLLDAARGGHQLWNKFDSKRKSDLLTPLLTDWTELVTIIESISDKEQAVLSDLLSITNVILLRRGVPPEFPTQLREIFQAKTSYDIAYKLRAMPDVLHSSVDSLASQINQISSVTGGLWYT